MRTNPHIGDVIEGFGQSHGLEALSPVASASHHPYLAPSANMIHQSIPTDGDHDPYSLNSPISVGDGKSASASQEHPVISPSNNLDFILNPTSVMISMIDPNLESPPLTANGSSPVSHVEAEHAIRSSPPDSNGDTEHKVTFLPYHLSEPLEQG